ncbi:MAG: hypothetical protein WB676_13615 [Bryobacteraceae bacterium]
MKNLRNKKAEQPSAEPAEEIPHRVRPRWANHWRQNFQNEAKALDREGLLEHYAELATERAADVLHQQIAKGLPYHQADELATQEWGTPPTLNRTTPTSHRAAERSLAPDLSTTTESQTEE